MKYIEFDRTKPLDFIPIGRIAIDFNPTDMYKPLSQSSNFNKYVGGSAHRGRCSAPAAPALPSICMPALQNLPFENKKTRI
jgi:hypothetical protein